MMPRRRCHLCDIISGFDAVFAMLIFRCGAYFLFADTATPLIRFLYAPDAATPLLRLLFLEAMSAARFCCRYAASCC